MGARLDLGWSPTVTATDSSSHGYGVMVKDVGSTVAERVGSFPERLRWKLGAGDRPRERALASVGIPSKERTRSAPLE
eukprot:1836312-Amphidinium_carterae.1